MALPADFAQHVKSMADTVCIVGETVTLKRSGANYLGLCPFYQEKNANVFGARDQAVLLLLRVRGQGRRVSLRYGDRGGCISRSYAARGTARWATGRKHRKRSCRYHRVPLRSTRLQRLMD